MTTFIIPNVNSSISEVILIIISLLIGHLFDTEMLKILFFIPSLTTNAEDITGCRVVVVVVVFIWNTPNKIIALDPRAILYCLRADFSQFAHTIVCIRI